MTIAERITRVFKADMHGLIDVLEDPGAVLRQAIREMELETAGNEAKLKDLAERESAVKATLLRLEQSIAETAEQLDLCIEADNDALAKKLIRRRLEAQNRKKKSEEVLASWESERARLAKLIVEQQEKLESMREKISIFCAPAYAADGCTEDPRISEEEVDVALLREKAKRRSAQKQ